MPFLSPEFTARSGGDVEVIRLHRSLVVRTKAGGHWGVAPDPKRGPGFHAVLEGETLVSTPGREPQLLVAGDVLWMPAGRTHCLTSHADIRVASCDRSAAQHSVETGSFMRVGFGSVQSRIVSIVYESDHPSTCPSLHAFAEPVLLRGEDDPTLLPLLRMLDAERANREPGAETAAGMMTELLLIRLHRTCRERGSALRSADTADLSLGVVARDAHALIHQHPEFPWTSDSLAAAVRVSRATLHRHFSKSLGTTPMRYLEQWRMQRAAQLLRSSDEPIQGVAASVGYSSPHAFSRAFRRTHGMSPRQYRGAEGRVRPSL